MMSVGVCWCLLMSVDVCWCLECVGVCGGVSGGYFGMSEVLKYVQRSCPKLNHNGNELEGSNYNVKA